MAGIDLSRHYYFEVIRPLLSKQAPGLAHSAALIGWGSDVLGFDSSRSTDHNWGPRCQVFLAPADGWRAAGISAMLAAELPATFLGWPTRFADVTAPGRPVRHWVDVAELGEWLTEVLGFKPRAEIGLLDWLATPTQRLAEVTGGAVFHDGLGSGLDSGSSDGLKGGLTDGLKGGLTDGLKGGLKGRLPGGLTGARAALRWYPDDIWRYVLACQWQRISEEAAFPGRCVEAGDDLGSAVVAARLVRDIIRLALLIRRRYPPYSKWLGSAFAGLGAEVEPLRRLLLAAMAPTTWDEREDPLCAAYQAVGRMQNGLGLTEPVDVAIIGFFDRPYRIIDAEAFAVALRESITTDEIRRLPMIGAVDQFVDSTVAAGQLGPLRASVAAQLSL